MRAVRRRKPTIGAVRAAAPGVISGGSAIDRRTTRHKGFAKSIKARRGIEKVFGWIQQWGGLRQFKRRGTEKVAAVFGLRVVACNLIRLGNLLRPAAEEAA